MPGRREGLPVDLAAAAAGVAALRRRHLGRRLPRRVWEVAAGLAACYGVGITARSLALDATELGRRVARPVRPRRAERRPRGTFVEILPRAAASAEACVLEVEHVGGLQVRVRLAVADAVLLERLLRALVRASA